MNVVFGINPVLELIRTRPGSIENLCVARATENPKIKSEIVPLAERSRIKVILSDKDQLNELAAGGVHQGIVARVRDFGFVDYAELLRSGASDRPVLVFLDGIQDPQNLGAIVRSAYAFGARGVVVPKDRAAQVSPVAMKASAGALVHCPVARVTNLSRALEESKEAGFWSAAADPEGDLRLWSAPLDGALAVVVGAEGAGVRPGVLKHCDYRVQIPMIGHVASLNASVSAAVLLCEAARQRSSSRNA